MSKKLVQRLLGLAINPLTVAAAGLVGFVFLLVTEDDLASAAFATMAVLLVAGFLVLTTRRPAFSVYSALALTLLVVGPSIVKARLTGASLHSLDFAHLADPKVSSFLLSGYTAYVVPILVALATAAVLLFLVYRAEAPQPGGLARRALLVLLPASLLPVALPQWASGDDYQFAGKHASAFAASLRELPHLWDAHPLAARLAAVEPAPDYETPLACGAAGAMPDIVLVHAESQLPPAHVPAWGTQMLTDSFAAADGRVRRFGVEIYGGSSWVTVSSVMSGLSGADFDWMRQFITTSMTGKVRDSVPAILAGCGYGTSAVLTFGYEQFDLGPFLSSLGVKTVLGAEETGIPVHGERDYRYFRAAMEKLREGRAGGKPQFVYVETMFTHSPYLDRLEPAARLDGEPFHEDAETAEFLRRLVIAREDVAALRETLARDPGPRGTILVEYGDHRPLVAPSTPRPDGTGGLADWGSPDYETYFAAHAFGAAVMTGLPDHDRLDAPYLGYWMLRAAGVARGGPVDAMERLRETCDGRFHTCGDRAAVDRVLRRRLDRGDITLAPLLGGSS